MARLKHGVSREQAEAAMNVVYRQINEQELKEIKTVVADLSAIGSVDKHLFLRPDRKGARICAISSRRRFSC